VSPGVTPGGKPDGELTETIPAALAGERLDRVVAMLSDVSRTEAAALLDSGSVTVDGRPVTKASTRVAEGAVVSFPRPSTEDEGGPQPDPSVVVPVVYEDDDLVVVDKPAGLVVHPGAGQARGTLVNGLVARYPAIASVGEPDRPGIVHRLDKGTSGLMLVARSAAAYDELVAMLAAHVVHRRYHALVLGHVEAPSGMVEAPIGRSQRSRTKMAVTVRGKPAATYYEVQRRFDQPTPTTELTCTLTTGRTHQIRVHMASIGHAVVGDARYGGVRPALPMVRPWLHAEHLSLEHPTTAEPLSFDSPLPTDLTEVLATLS
jgi:23S rRNA pseudouridine1911/1915/1917 synthase